MWEGCLWFYIRLFAGCRLPVAGCRLPFAGCRLPLRRLSHRSGNRQPKTHVKPEAAITVFELLMMGGVSPETY
jgi:hypothetical protein